MATNSSHNKNGDHGISKASNGSIGNIPHEFVCPLTHEVFHSPIVTRYGHTFEREALMKWLDENGSICPFTRQPLSMSDLIINRNLLTKIRQWKLKHENDDGNSGIENMDDDGSSLHEHVLASCYVSAKNMKKKRNATKANRGYRKPTNDQKRTGKLRFKPVGWATAA